MLEKIECRICYLKQCVSVIDDKTKQAEPWRLEYVPWMPWVHPQKESVADCPVRRDPETHQREINMYKLPKIT
jgi:hypothetical protein